MHNNKEKLKLIGRINKLFVDDINLHEKEILDIVSESKFLVLGGAGSIGQAVTKEIFKRNPKKLHVIDISENNLVELVRDIRSSFGYINGEFKTFALDIGSIEYDAFFNSDGNYDYVLNLSALKHVRSEEDPFTLMRMIDVNIFNTDKTLKQCIEKGVKKYFCVSTDKAANPVNMMGASKRIMEMFVSRRSENIDVSMARFANVAFSDGSLLHGFNQRIEKKQPIVAPDDVKRYFIIDEESGELCLMSALFGKNCDIFFPKPNENLSLIKFSEIAKKYLENKKLKPIMCNDEDEARNLLSTINNSNHWPCLFTKSTTTGEKDFEEFFTDKEILDMSRFSSIGIVENKDTINENILDSFESNINKMIEQPYWSKKDILDNILKVLPEFKHKDTGSYLDEKM
jgi:FlaA1/EpsC-like NDP-sugar epimerase|tara:strand:+ start:3915 stop:5114 length:1200 start_codon:yes stop_codon:yes gene_type:complete